jgi:hypothetical protein
MSTRCFLQENKECRSEISAYQNIFIGRFGGNWFLGACILNGVMAMVWLCCQVFNRLAATHLELKCRNVKPQACKVFWDFMFLSSKAYKFKSVRLLHVDASMLSDMEKP